MNTSVMGLEDENGPPKKKLKQAQLSFANVTPKSHKRKLSSEANEIQSSKIICKETEKENVEINTKYQGGDNGTKQDEPAFVDLTSDDSPQKKVIPSIHGSKERPPSPQNTQDFSLVLSESVLDSINCKDEKREDNSSKNYSQHQETSSVIVNELETGNSSSISGQTSEVEETVKTDSLTTPSNTLSESLIEEDLNKTLSSDEDVSLSPEQLSKKKGSPTTPKLKLTPKRIESLKRKEERERIKSEKRAEKAKLREEKLKLKQQKDDLKRKEKEEKEKKRQAELKIKEEEKKVKEEEKKKKEEEKKQKEEEKRLKEEEKKKKEEIEEKKKAAFANFFIPKKKQPDANDKNEATEEVKFMPFPMKSDMRVAIEPHWKISSDEKKILDDVLSGGHKNNNLYITELKNGNHVPQRKEATWPVQCQEEEHDVIIIESTENGDCIDLTQTNKEVHNKNGMKAKLLQFHDNRRPPYWGTWRKKSKTVGPRRPLGQDKVIFDYEVDSDSEWEDEGEGEDIDKEGDSDEEQGEEEDNDGENGYMLDNTFVPHGYLSDEEVLADEDVEDNNPENIKLRMKLLKQEFDEEMKSKTERLKPRLLGCVWISNGTTEVSSGSLYESLLRYRAVWNENEGPIDLSGPEVEESPSSVAQTKSKPFPPLIAPLLAKLVHECHMPLSALVKEFLLFLEKEHPSEHVTKRAVTLKIKEIASKTFDVNGKSIWAVNQSLCEEYGLKPLNQTPNIVPPAPQPVVEKPKDNILVNFLKGAQTPQPVKKRVSLIPVPAVENTPNSKGKENGKATYVSTPRPVDPVLKKRAQLITLSRTPENTASSSVHQDTPRPSHVIPKLGTIDLCADSP